MPVNNFKPFSIATNANVTSQSDYENLPALIAGFTSGKASSAQINKALRQATVMSSVLAQFIVNNSGNDVLDNGDTTAVLNNLALALIASGEESFLKISNNFSEIKLAGSDEQSSARNNLGLKGAAILDVGSLTGTVAAGDDLRITGAAQKENNLSDLTDKAQALINLGLTDNKFAGRLLNVQVFESSGTYTPTPGAKNIIVECQGGGGSGAGTTNSGSYQAGGGGAGGAYIKAMIAVTVPISVIIGGGGVSGSGGQSSFGSYLTSPGGGFGSLSASTSAGTCSQGGACTNPTSSGVAKVITVKPGSPGGLSVITTAQGVCGNGGDSMLGTGAVGQSSSSNPQGIKGSGYGGGGSGSMKMVPNSDAFIGGGGASGAVIIWEYA